MIRSWRIVSATAGGVSSDVGVGDGVEHAFVWKDGVMTDVQANSPKAIGGDAVGINNRGQIVGSITDMSKSCAARCDMHGAIWAPRTEV